MVRSRLEVSEILCIIMISPMSSSNTATSSFSPQPPKHFSSTSPSLVNRTTNGVGFSVRSVLFSTQNSVIVALLYCFRVEPILVVTRWQGWRTVHKPICLDCCRVRLIVTWRQRRKRHLRQIVICLCCRRISAAVTIDIATSFCRAALHMQNQRTAAISIKCRRSL